MSPGVRSLSASLALVTVTVAYLLLQRSTDRPSPQLAVLSAPAARPAPRPALATARTLLDRAVQLDLSADQMVRLRALDRLWSAEKRTLERSAGEAEREFAAFINETQRMRGSSVEELQRRSAEFREASAALRESWQRQSEASLRLLADWQRIRLSRMKLPAGWGGDDEIPKD